VARPKLKIPLRDIAAALAAVVLSAGPGPAAERLPIFDTHVHYSREAWAPFPPAAVLEKLNAAGVPRALVSSTPDVGTVALYEAAPALDLNLHAGIGEFHLMDLAEAGTPQMRSLIKAAMARGLILHVHSGADQIEALFAIEPKLRILWAHAGMAAPPEVVGPLLDRYETLWTELSFRAADVAQGGDIEPAWRGLLLRHVDRFMIGTDTYTNGRWDQYRALVEQQRAWVSQLPPEAARAIAYSNAVRLFGPGKAQFWP
jgi:hypothetical protein